MEYRFTPLSIRQKTTLKIPNNATHTYSCAPMGPDQFKKSISQSETMMEEGYIVVYQDVRGRWMSDGLYDNMRAYIPNKNQNGC
jgi:predicted acyl esterase